MAIRKKALVLLLAVLLVLSGCSASGADWVYEYNGEQLPVGLYNAYMLSALGEIELKVNEANANVENYTAPKMKDLLKTDMDGVSGEQWVKDNAYAAVQNYFWIKDTAARLGVSLDNDMEAYAASSVAQRWSYYSEDYEKNGISQNSLLLMEQAGLLQQVIFTELYGEEGEFAVPEQELRDLFAETYALGEYLHLGKEASAGEDDAAEAAAANEEIKAMADEYMQRLNAGESLEALTLEYEFPDGDQELIDAHERHLALFSDSADDRAYYGEALVDGILSAPVGRHIMVEEDEYYLFYIRYDLFEDPSYFEGMRMQLLFNEKYGEYLDYVEEQSAAMSITPNEKALKKYTPSKLKDVS